MDDTFNPLDDIEADRVLDSRKFALETAVQMHMSKFHQRGEATTDADVVKTAATFERFLTTGKEDAANG